MRIALIAVATAAIVALSCHHGVHAQSSSDAPAPTTSSSSPLVAPPAPPADAATVKATLAQASQALALFLQQGNGCSEVSDLGASAPSLDMAALWLRALFHDSGTYDASTKSQGLDGSLLNELDATENKGLQGKGLATNVVVGALRAKASFLSDADLIALGAHVTLAHCGGLNVPFQFGRGTVARGVMNNITLLASNATAPLDETLTKFKRMGLSKLDALLLISGSHSMGGAHKAISPTLTDQRFAPFDDTPQIFDNDVFKKLADGKCVLPVDCALAADPELAPYVSKYAADQQAFFDAYAVSVQKMLSLTGSSSLSAPYDLGIAKHTFQYDTNQTLLYFNGSTKPESSTSSASGTSVTVLPTSTSSRSDSTSCRRHSAYGFGLAAGVAAALALIV